MCVAVECWSSLRPSTKICFFSQRTRRFERKPPLPTAVQPQPSETAVPALIPPLPPPQPPAGLSEWPAQAPSVWVQPLILLAEQRLTSTPRAEERQGELSLPPRPTPPPTPPPPPPLTPPLPPALVPDLPPSIRTLAERRRTCKRLSNPGGSHSTHFWRRFKTLPGNWN